MNAPRRNRHRGKRPQNRGSNTKQPTVQELWKPVPTPDAPAPIKGVSDPSVLIDSLGSPPLRSHSTTAERYVATVVERAATLATALAQSADVLADADDI